MSLAYLCVLVYYMLLCIALCNYSLDHHMKVGPWNTEVLKSCMYIEELNVICLVCVPCFVPGLYAWFVCLVCIHTFGESV